jgi:hypothetical protein
LRRKAWRHRAQSATLAAAALAVSPSVGGAAMALIVRWILRLPKVEKKTPRDDYNSFIALNESDRAKRMTSLALG